MMKFRKKNLFKYFQGIKKWLCNKFTTQEKQNHFNLMRILSGIKSRIGSRSNGDIEIGLR